MSYDKYKRRRQHLNTLTVVTKDLLTKAKSLILAIRLTQSNQWVGVDHAARIQSLNSSSIE